MARPHEFREACIAIRNIPYLRVSPPHFASEGVLAKGTLVWVQTMIGAEERPTSISAFVDDFGIISLDPRWLAFANPDVSVLMDQIASLEKLVCHLLRRNEELRMALHESAPSGALA
jgi:hypothetical protein